jgi:hypothetical protein
VDFLFAFFVVPLIEISFVFAEEADTMKSSIFYSSLTQSFESGRFYGDNKLKKLAFFSNKFFTLSIVSMLLKFIFFQEDHQFLQPKNLSLKHKSL